MGIRKGPPQLYVADAETAELFRLYLIRQERRGNLPSSIYTARGRLRSFARYLQPRNLLDATRDDIEAFLDGRRTRDGRKITARTRHGLISHLHSFYAWAVAEELLEKDPTLSVVRPKLRNNLPRPIGDEDLARALAEADPAMLCMLSLAAFAGLRCQEIAGLDREDVLEGKGLIRVIHGKGDKERIVPLHPDALSALRRLPMPRGGPLFTRPQGGRHQGWTMSYAINTYLKGLGIDATAHCLRHWFATNVYASGHDIRVTQELLGHSNLSTTARYVAYSSVDAAAAVGALHIG